MSIEPFGYFKAEPFGWTDCAETEAGAVPLYERSAIEQAVAPYREDAERRPAEGPADDPVAWMVFAGVLQSRPVWPPHRTAVEASRAAAEIKSATVVVPLFRQYAAQKDDECETCRGNGMIGGPSHYAPDEGGVPCPDCSPQEGGA